MEIKSFKAALSAFSTIGHASSGERDASAAEVTISNLSRSDAWRGNG